MCEIRPFLHELRDGRDAHRATGALPSKSPIRWRSRLAVLHCGLAADNVAHFKVGSALGRWPTDYGVPLILTPQAAGGYTATSPLLPELVAEGSSVGEALENVKAALAAAIELHKGIGRSLPLGKSMLARGLRLDA